MALSTREAYGQALVELAERYEFLVLDADLSKATQTVHFSAKYPGQFFNMGIAEGNMMSVAAGMAACGKTVVASTFAVFAAGRAFEQVRNAIAYTGLNVKICASHGGVLIGEDGGSHQAVEDLSNMRGLPGMTVLAPCDPESTRRALEAALRLDGPVYLRLNRFPAGDVYDLGGCDFQIGRGNLLREGGDLTLLAHGDLVPVCLEAAALLAGRGISASVADMCSIKPLDRELVLAQAAKTGRILTAEDHNIIGGLGSAVAEVLAEAGAACRLRRVGVPDCFGFSATRADLAAHFGFTPEGVAAQAEALLTATT